MKTLLRKFASRKLAVFIGVTIVAALNDRMNLGLTPDQIQDVVHTGMAYLIGQGIADMANRPSL